MYHCNILVYTTGLINILVINYPTWHGNGVFVTSGRRRLDVKTTLRRRFGVMVALLLHYVSTGHGP